MTSLCSFCRSRYINTLKNADGSLNEEGKMLIADDMSGSEDSEESDSEDERVDAAFIKKMLGKSGGAVAAAGSDSDSDSDEEEEEEPAPKKTKAPVVTTPAGKKSKQNTPASKAKVTPSSNQKKNQKSGEKRKR